MLTTHDTWLRSLGYRPGAIAYDDRGRAVELMSYPFPLDGGGWACLARSTPGDPTTLEPYIIPPYALDLIE